MNHEPLWHDAFYQLTSVPDPQALAGSLQRWAQTLTGCLWVAPDGLNGTLAGTSAALAEFRHHLLHNARWGSLWSGMLFNRTACRTPPFQRLKVVACKALLPLRRPTVSPPPPQQPADATGVQPLSPLAWRNLIRQHDTVLIDNRNSFEYRLGHFHGAIDPQVQHFRDFPAFLELHSAGFRASNQRVAMYCTGGIRCDVAQSWAQALGLQVFTLQGGILNYLAHIPDATQDWVGDCFVFDNRLALNAQLQETNTCAVDIYTAPEDTWRLARAKQLQP